MLFLAGYIFISLVSARIARARIGITAELPWQEHRHDCRLKRRAGAGHCDEECVGERQFWDIVNILLVTFFWPIALFLVFVFAEKISPIALSSSARLAKISKRAEKNSKAIARMEAELGLDTLV